ncbi:mediator of RNA polymerase II transcription subunit 33A-like [Impatiens glandulifera]|uniref:mediator of RNA polymerase II transcription subunit 33A-like n=1 Tax=Impatiens glandulifera TaxID=253017 RepID=UPI001FB0D05E|nr:mediator of RNA polymerase II transcription subunit 33A-like [Impatiens glandulifera]
MAKSIKHSSMWDSVLELTKSAQDSGSESLPWAIQLYSSLTSAGVPLPSPELADLLVSHICWDNNVPIAWKFLDMALMMKIVPPTIVLALLSKRVVPVRRLHPAAFRLYMELLKRHAFSLSPYVNSPDYEKIMKSIDDVLHLSQIFGLGNPEPGILLVLFILSIVWQLLDASLDDERLLELTPEKKSRWLAMPDDMDVDCHDNFDEKRSENRDSMYKSNTIMAIQLVGEYLKNKDTSRILFLARRNLPSHWDYFLSNIRVLAAKSSILRNMKDITPEGLLQLTSDTRRLLHRLCKANPQQQLHAVLSLGGQMISAGQCHGISRSALWLPFDIFLEDSLDASQVAATSAVEVLTGLVKALRAINQASWHDTFLALWIAALRLVQRERDPSEGPAPPLDTCLCMLLSVTTLAIWHIVDEEETSLINNADCSSTNQKKEKQVPGRCRKDLVSSLQQLGDNEGLLSPPLSVVQVANQAVAKAMMCLSGPAIGSGYLDCVSLNDMPVHCSGNMRHLIVEACIARNLLDTSAYMWPGYVKGRANQLPRNPVVQMPGWSSFMKGGPLTLAMVNALVASPASSLAEIEKVFEITINGSDDEKLSAAAIFCGASLTRGWNIQEHIMVLITKMLQPPVPIDHTGSESHLIRYAPFLNALLIGISSAECVQIFSLHGVVPSLAGTLMPICEVFGSCAPTFSWTLPSGEEISSYGIFSNAFTLLLKLWRFDRPPIEHVNGDVAPVGSQLTPEYLLLVRNAQLASYANTLKDKNKNMKLTKHATPTSLEPIFMDIFPNLKRWYRQHQECIASTLSALVNGSPVHQTVEGLLNMMFKKANRGGGGQPLSTTSGSTNSSGSAVEEVPLQLQLPAWDILEATPFVLDAGLTACAHGRLSPRELVTGLKDLADFLPASMVTIVSYLSAEVTRGIWKPASMNGTDWPSPGAYLSTVEQQIKKILAGTGVEVPSLSAGSSPTTLPLPLAALVSLTITYKLDKASERLLFMIGPALDSLAAGCPWPCMLIISSLWAQKVKRWSDFLIFSASRTVFHHNNDAVHQLLRICFNSTLGINSSLTSSCGGVGALLGHGFGSHYTGGMSPVAPGILYLRFHRTLRNVTFVTEEILVLLMRAVKDIATRGGGGLATDRTGRRKTKLGMRYGQVSLTGALLHVKVAASLGASLVWVAGGLSLVQSLIKETLPSWFLSSQGAEDGDLLIAMLRGYALAYFAVLSGTFAWGIDSVAAASKRRRNILRTHLEFVASAVDGKISLGCDSTTWRAYVSGFVSLMVGCTPTWMLEVDVEVLKRVSKGLRKWNEDELALALLAISGVDAMGAAAELIVDAKF